MVRDSEHVDELIANFREIVCDYMDEHLQGTGYATFTLGLSKGQPMIEVKVPIWGKK